MEACIPNCAQENQTQQICTDFGFNTKIACFMHCWQLTFLKFKKAINSISIAFNIGATISYNLNSTSSFIISATFNVGRMNSL